MWKTGNVEPELYAFESLLVETLKQLRELCASVRDKELVAAMLR
ncbi:MAG: hypothetical protein WC340_17475 [Kiritimatiellia bacterium]|jgi:hypothetical protein